MAEVEIPEEAYRDARAAAASVAPDLVRAILEAAAPGIDRVARVAELRDRADHYTSRAVKAEEPNAGRTALWLIARELRRRADEWGTP